MRDGTRRDVMLNKATFVDPSGAIAGLVGVIVDITQRKQLEANTRESNERLRAVIHAAPMAIIARDKERRIRMWNPSAERMFGWSEEEVLNTTTSIIPDYLKEATTELRRRAEAGETIVLEETQRKHRDGHLLDVSMSIAPIYDADRRAEAPWYRGHLARKQAEQALRESGRDCACDEAADGHVVLGTDTDRFTHSGPPFGSPRPLVDTGPPGALHPEDRDLFARCARDRHGGIQWTTA